MNQKQLLFLVLFVIQSATICCSQESDNTPKQAEELRKKIVNGQAQISNYNTACYFALKGEQTLAFAYLKKAVFDDGFSNLKTIEKDTDLNSLHKDSLWPVIYKGVKDNAAKYKEAEGTFFNQASFWESGILQTPYRENISENEKIAGLSKFWSEAKYNFVNFDLIPDVDLDSLYFAYLPKVRQTRSTLEYYRTMEKFAALLRDGHTNVIVPKELTNEVYARPLLRSRLTENKVLVTGIYDPALKKQGIREGQEIVEINGLPVKEYAAKYVIPYQCSSTPQDLEVRAYDYALFSGSINEPIQLRLRDAKGNTEDHTIYRVKGEERSGKMAVPPFEHKMLKENIAYIALNSFGNDSAAKAFTAHYEQISKAKAIIFDVRNNGGGNTSVGWKILDYLIEKPELVHSWYTREYKPSYRAWNHIQQVHGGKSYLSPNGKFFYNKPVIVLTSARTFSAAEDFAGAFKSLHRGLIVGEPTGGSSGQPLFISLPGNGKARICTKRDMLANGEDFVGKGVLPDKLVLPTVADTRKGIDTQLEAALRELSKL
ncbi:S41 family peptidase [Sinomicrobium weinanense]|uniref:Tail specific protease domain-containing protein n=1 Tax=Sinomicrobium weinanense TaxID=2842200 RepID=A0A926Q5E0_9FLAO|nr:S41 family peptidase [Sinomicrobium weinanense]MBC9798056.1 hypothetical protein [Sinomicrobium weinanense]MBU3122531.1 hypothetical protein [Sinomicrobium weinanense]